MPKYTHIYLTASLFWGNSSLLSRTFSLQKKAFQAIYRVPIRTPGRPLFVSSSILTLPSIYILTCAMFVRNNPHLFPVNANLHDHNTRSRSNIHTLHYSYSLCLKGPYHSIATAYNKIPITIRSISSSIQFKAKLKHMLIEKSYYNLNEFLTGVAH